jgi:hypothetical protein
LLCAGLIVLILSGAIGFLVGHGVRKGEKCENSTAMTVSEGPIEAGGTEVRDQHEFMDKETGKTNDSESNKTAIKPEAKAKMAENTNSNGTVTTSTTVVSPAPKTSNNTDGDETSTIRSLNDTAITATTQKAMNIGPDVTESIVDDAAITSNKSNNTNESLTDTTLNEHTATQTIIGPNVTKPAMAEAAENTNNTNSNVTVSPPTLEPPKITESDEVSETPEFNVVSEAVVDASSVNAPVTPTANDKNNDEGASGETDVGEPENITENNTEPTSEVTEAAVEQTTNNATPMTETAVPASTESST